MVICYFGDSITLGYGDPSGLGWPGRLSGTITTLGADVTSYNLGVRKDTTVGLCDRWQDEAELRLLPELDLKLVFSFGVADIMTGVARNDSMAAAETILTQAKTFGEVLLVGPTPVANKAKTEAITDLSDAFEGLCETLDVPCVPVIRTMLESDIYRQALADGDSVHPSAMGYADLTECILQSKPARLYFGLE